MMKICLNCGDKLLDAAKKCPHCGTKDNGFPIVNSNDKEKIESIIASVPNPKSGTSPKWEKNLEMRGNLFVAGQQKAKAEKIKKLDIEGTAYCPKCLSTSLTAQKKGFGAGKALAGAFVVSNPLGLLAGGIGSKKIEVTCLKCGHKFTPGK